MPAMMDIAVSITFCLCVWVYLVCKERRPSL